MTDSKTLILVGLGAFILWKAMSPSQSIVLTNASNSSVVPLPGQGIATVVAGTTNMSNIPSLPESSSPFVDSSKYSIGPQSSVF